MPAKPLTPEQKEDAARLKAAFRAWQDAQRDKGAPVSQLEAAGRLGFGQSALSQYLNGLIPLNGPVLAKFAELMSVKPEDISPSIVAQESQRSQTWAPTESALEQVALQAFRLRGIKAEPVKLLSKQKQEALPEWLRKILGLTYYPGLQLTLPDSSHAWVEVKSPHALSGLGPHLVKLQAEHPREFLLLMADAPDVPRIVDGWLQRRTHPEGASPDPEPPRHRMRNQRPVWVVGRTQGGMPERVWDDGDHPVGMTDEFAEVSTSDEHAFACRVVGDSMVPRYMPGEYALVEPGTMPELEDDVLVRLATGETMLKRLLSRRGGVRLGSYNSQDVHTFRDDEITWMYYVAHPIPARKIRQRIDSGDYRGPDRRLHDDPVDFERRGTAWRVTGEGGHEDAPAPARRRKSA